MFRKLAATLLIILLFATNCLFAYSVESNFWAERSKAKPKLELARLLPTPNSYVGNPNPNNFSVPFGKTDRISPTTAKKQTEKIVFHIQDIHRNAEAQLAIAKTIERLIRTHHVKTVALEGAFGVLPVQGFQRYPHQSSIRQVADAFLKQNEIGGPLYAALVSGNPDITFVGVDDRAHYRRNVEAVKASFRIAAERKKELLRHEQELRGKKKAVFNPRLFDFDQKTEAYRVGTLALGDYVRFLGNDSKSLQPTPDLRKYLEALDIETSLNFATVERERASLLSQLNSKLTDAGKNELMKMAVAYRDGQIAQGEFYDRLEKLCASNGISLGSFHAFADYIRYCRLADGIDGARLFKELRDIEDRRIRELAENAEERKLVEESRRLFLTKKLVDFSLTREEWDDYKQVMGSGISWLRSTLRKSLRQDISDPISSPLESFEQFYREAELRDQAMAQNFINTPCTTHNAPCTAVLVTGGFHSAGIDKKLIDAGYTVYTFTPKITKVDTEKGAEYLSVFTQEKTPLEEIFEGEKLFLTPEVLSVPLHVKTAGAVGFNSVVEGFSEEPENDFDGLVSPCHATLTSVKGSDSDFSAEINNSLTGEATGVEFSKKRGTSNISVRLVRLWKKRFINEEIIYSILLFDYFRVLAPIEASAPAWYQVVRVALLVVSSIHFARSHKNIYYRAPNTGQIYRAGRAKTIHKIYFTLMGLLFRFAYVAALFPVPFANTMAEFGFPIAIGLHYLNVRFLSYVLPMATVELTAEQKEQIVRPVIERYVVTDLSALATEDCVRIYDSGGNAYIIFEIFKERSIVTGESIAGNIAVDLEALLAPGRTPGNIRRVVHKPASEDPVQVLNANLPALLNAIWVVSAGNEERYILPQELDVPGIDSTLLNTCFGEVIRAKQPGGQLADIANPEDRFLWALSRFQNLFFLPSGWLLLATQNKFPANSTRFAIDYMVARNVGRGKPVSVDGKEYPLYRVSIPEDRSFRSALLISACRIYGDHVFFWIDEEALKKGYAHTSAEFKRRRDETEVAKTIYTYEGAPAGEELALATVAEMQAATVYALLQDFMGIKTATDVDKVSLATVLYGTGRGQLLNLHLQARGDRAPAVAAWAQDLFGKLYCFKHSLQSTRLILQMVCADLVSNGAVDYERLVLRYMQSKFGTFHLPEIDVDWETFIRLTGANISDRSIKKYFGKQIPAGTIKITEEQRRYETDHLTECLQALWRRATVAEGNITMPDALLQTPEQQELQDRIRVKLNRWDYTGYFGPELTQAERFLRLLELFITDWWVPRGLLPIVTRGVSFPADPAKFGTDYGLAPISEELDSIDVNEKRSRLFDIDSSDIGTAIVGFYVHANMILYATDIARAKRQIQSQISQGQMTLTQFPGMIEQYGSFPHYKELTVAFMALGRFQFVSLLRIVYLWNRASEDLPDPTALRIAIGLMCNDPYAILYWCSTMADATRHGDQEGQRNGDAVLAALHEAVFPGQYTGLTVDFAAHFGPLVKLVRTELENALNTALEAQATKPNMPRVEFGWAKFFKSVFDDESAHAKIDEVYGPRDQRPRVSDERLEAERRALPNFLRAIWNLVNGSVGDFNVPREMPPLSQEEEQILKACRQRVYEGGFLATHNDPGQRFRFALQQFKQSWFLDRGLMLIWWGLEPSTNPAQFDSNYELARIDDSETYDDVVMNGKKLRVIGVEMDKTPMSAAYQWLSPQHLFGDDAYFWVNASMQAEGFSKIKEFLAPLDPKIWSREDGPENCKLPLAVVSHMHYAAIKGMLELQDAIKYPGVQYALASQAAVISGKPHGLLYWLSFFVRTRNLDPAMRRWAQVTIEYLYRSKHPDHGPTLPATDAVLLDLGDETPAELEQRYANTIRARATPRDLDYDPSCARYNWAKIIKRVNTGVPDDVIDRQYGPQDVPTALALFKPQTDPTHTNKTEDLDKPGAEADADSTDTGTESGSGAGTAAGTSTNETEPAPDIDFDAIYNSFTPSSPMPEPNYEAIKFKISDKVSVSLRSALTDIIKEALVTDTCAVELGKSNSRVAVSFERRALGKGITVIIPSNFAGTQDQATIDSIISQVKDRLALVQEEKFQIVSPTGQIPAYLPACEREIWHWVDVQLAAATPLWGDLLQKAGDGNDVERHTLHFVNRWLSTQILNRHGIHLCMYEDSSTPGVLKLETAPARIVLDAGEMSLGLKKTRFLYVTTRRADLNRKGIHWQPSVGACCLKLPPLEESQERINATEAVLSDPRHENYSFVNAVTSLGVNWKRFRDPLHMFIWQVMTITLRVWIVNFVRKGKKTGEEAGSPVKLEDSSPIDQMWSYCLWVCHPETDFDLMALGFITSFDLNSSGNSLAIPTDILQAFGSNHSKASLFFWRWVAAELGVDVDDAGFTWPTLIRVIDAVAQIKRSDPEKYEEVRAKIATSTNESLKGAVEEARDQFKLIQKVRVRVAGENYDLPVLATSPALTKEGEEKTPAGASGAADSGTSGGEQTPVPPKPKFTQQELDDIYNSVPPTTSMPEPDRSKIGVPDWQGNISNDLKRELEKTLREMALADHHIVRVVKKGTVNAEFIWPKKFGEKPFVRVDIPEDKATRKKEIPNIINRLRQLAPFLQEQKFAGVAVEMYSAFDSLGQTERWLDNVRTRLPACDVTIFNWIELELGKAGGHWLEKQPRKLVSRFAVRWANEHCFLRYRIAWVRLTLGDKMTFYPARILAHSGFMHSVPIFQLATSNPGTELGQTGWASDLGAIYLRPKSHREFIKTISQYKRKNAPDRGGIAQLLVSSASNWIDLLDDRVRTFVADLSDVMNYDWQDSLSSLKRMPSIDGDVPHWIDSIVAQNFEELFGELIYFLFVWAYTPPQHCNIMTSWLRTSVPVNEAGEILPLSSVPFHEYLARHRQMFDFLIGLSGRLGLPAVALNDWQSCIKLQTQIINAYSQSPSLFEEARLEVLGYITKLTGSRFEVLGRDLTDHRMVTVEEQKGKWVEIPVLPSSPELEKAKRPEDEGQKPTTDDGAGSKPADTDTTDTTTTEPDTEEQKPPVRTIEEDLQEISMLYDEFKGDTNVWAEWIGIEEAQRLEQMLWEHERCEEIRNRRPGRKVMAELVLASLTPEGRCDLAPIIALRHIDSQTPEVVQGWLRDYFRETYDLSGRRPSWWFFMDLGPLPPEAAFFHFIQDPLFEDIRAHNRPTDEEMISICQRLGLREDWIATEWNVDEVVVHRWLVEFLVDHPVRHGRIGAMAAVPGLDRAAVEEWLAAHPDAGQRAQEQRILPPRTDLLLASIRRHAGPLEDLALEWEVSFMQLCDWIYDEPVPAILREVRHRYPGPTVFHQWIVTYWGDWEAISKRFEIPIEQLRDGWATAADRQLALCLRAIDTSDITRMLLLKMIRDNPELDDADRIRILADLREVASSLFKTPEGPLELHPGANIHLGSTGSEHYIDAEGAYTIEMLKLGHSDVNLPSRYISNYEVVPFRIRIQPSLTHHRWLNFTHVFVRGALQKQIRLRPQPDGSLAAEGEVILKEHDEKSKNKFEFFAVDLRPGHERVIRGPVHIVTIEYRETGKLTEAEALARAEFMRDRWIHQLDKNWALRLERLKRKIASILLRDVTYEQRPDSTGLVPSFARLDRFIDLMRQELRVRLTIDNIQGRTWKNVEFVEETCFREGGLAERPIEELINDNRYQDLCQRPELLADVHAVWILKSIRRDYEEAGTEPQPELTASAEPRTFAEEWTVWKLWQRLQKGRGTMVDVPFKLRMYLSFAIKCVREKKRDVLIVMDPDLMIYWERALAELADTDGNLSDLILNLADGTPRERDLKLADRPTAPRVILVGESYLRTIYKERKKAPKKQKDQKEEKEPESRKVQVEGKGSVDLADKLGGSLCVQLVMEGQLISSAKSKVASVLRDLGKKRNPVVIVGGSGADYSNLRTFFRAVNNVDSRLMASGNVQTDKKPFNEENADHRRVMRELSEQCTVHLDPRRVYPPNSVEVSRDFISHDLNREQMFDSVTTGLNSFMLESLGGIALDNRFISIYNREDAKVAALVAKIQAILEERPHAQFVIWTRHVVKDKVMAKIERALNDARPGIAVICRGKDRAELDAIRLKAESDPNVRVRIVNADSFGDVQVPDYPWTDWVFFDMVRNVHDDRLPYRHLRPLPNGEKRHVWYMTANPNIGFLFKMGFVPAIFYLLSCMGGLSRELDRPERTASTQARMARLTAYRPATEPDQTDLESGETPEERDLRKVRELRAESRELIANPKEEEEGPTDTSDDEEPAFETEVDSSDWADWIPGPLAHVIQREHKMLTGHSPWTETARRETHTERIAIFLSMLKRNGELLVPKEKRNPGKNTIAEFNLSDQELSFLVTVEGQAVLVNGQDLGEFIGDQLPARDRELFVSIGQEIDRAVGLPHDITLLQNWCRFFQKLSDNSFQEPTSEKIKLLRHVFENFIRNQRLVPDGEIEIPADDSELAPTKYVLSTPLEDLQKQEWWEPFLLGIYNGHAPAPQKEEYDEEILPWVMANVHLFYVHGDFSGFVAHVRELSRRLNNFFRKQFTAAGGSFAVVGLISNDFWKKADYTWLSSLIVWIYLAWIAIIVIAVLVCVHEGLMTLFNGKSLTQKTDSGDDAARWFDMLHGDALNWGLAGNGEFVLPATKENIPQIRLLAMLGNTINVLADPDTKETFEQLTYDSPGLISRIVVLESKHKFRSEGRNTVVTPTDIEDALNQLKLRGVNKDQLCLGFLPNIRLDEEASRPPDDPLSTLNGLRVLVLQISGLIVPLEFQNWDQIMLQLRAAAEKA